MGQRHQAFLIAQIIPKNETHARYRCIAAIHHQWCNGIRPLEAANRLIILLRQPQNAMIVREELKTLHGKYGRKGKPGKDSISPKVPAPYNAFLLQCAFYTDIPEGKNIVSSNKCIESANLASSETDNNDGITIIDVTDPEDPHYCFIQFLDFRILSAQGYVRGYFPAPFPPEYYARDADRPMRPEENERLADNATEEEIEGLISQFSDVKLINYNMLAEAWPDEYDPEEPGGTESSGEDAMNLSSLIPSVPPLVQISLKPAVISAIEDDRLDVLDHYLSDPTLRHAIKQIIVQDSALQDKSLVLLSKIVSFELEHDSQVTIDLSDLRLSSEQIMDILIPHRQSISSLNLSRNPNVTSQTLIDVLTNLENVRRLILFNTSITRDDLIILFKHRPSLFYKLSTLIHPALLDQTDKELAWASDFGHYSYQIIGTIHPSATVTLPFFSPTQVVQSIITLFEGANGPDYLLNIMTPFASITQVAYASEYREKGHQWNERLVSICPQDFPHPALLRLHGWVFLWDKVHTIHQYVWIRFNAKAIEECEAIPEIVENPVERARVAVDALGEELFEMYNFQGFLDACVAEGRPPIPEDLRKTVLAWLEKWKPSDIVEEEFVKYGHMGLLGDMDRREAIFRPMVSASRVLTVFKQHITLWGSQGLNWG